MPTPSPTAVPTPYADRLIALLKDVEIMGGVGIEAVNAVRIDPTGDIEIEYRTRYATKAHQADVSWQVIQAISVVATEWTPETTLALFGTEDWKVDLTTYSSLGDYRYISLTPLALLKQVANKEVTYNEWVAASSAGFQ